MELKKTHFGCHLLQEAFPSSSQRERLPFPISSGCLYLRSCLAVFLSVQPRGRPRPESLVWGVRVSTAGGRCDRDAPPPHVALEQVSVAPRLAAMAGRD